MDNYLINTNNLSEYNERNLVLVIYDIVNNKKRTKLFKFLSGYLTPVQKSCFEGYLTESQINEIKDKINLYIDKKLDNVRIYQLSAYGKVYNYGKNRDDEIENILII